MRADAETAGFTPFVATLADDVEAAARRLLGVPDAVALRWDARLDPDDSDAIGRLCVRLAVRDGDELVMELHEPADAQVRWRRAAATGDSEVGLGYQRLANGADPWADRGLRPFVEAMARFFVAEPFVDVGPVMNVGRTSDGRTSDGPVMDVGRTSDAPTLDELAKLRTALRRHRDFAGIRDHMFRQVNAGSHDAVGNLRLGFRCNQDCGMCWQGRRWPEPDVGLYRTWLDEMATMGVKTLALSGGEPTLHPDLAALIEHAERRLGLEVTLQTNAVQLAKPRVLDRLVAAGLKRVFVSLHSMDPAISDAMTRAPGTHSRTVQGIANCLAAGVQVNLNCVVERRNHDSLAASASAIVERFAGAERPENQRIADVTFSHPCSSFSADWYAEQAVPLDAIAPHLQAALRVLGDGGVRTFALGTCGFVPCVLHDAPDLLATQLDHTPPAESADETDTAGRTWLEPCGRCAVRARCLGIRKEYTAIYGTVGLHPIA